MFSYRIRAVPNSAKAHQTLKRHPAHEWRRQDHCVRGHYDPLAGWFSNANGIERPVIDQTGLTGHYDFTLAWSNPLAGTPDSTDPSIFTAMPEQLGLKLEPRQVPVEVFVIDRAEIPDEN
jgi:uncharacterized protein (TIGR03435 family)